jgi:hypothetical protein
MILFFEVACFHSGISLDFVPWMLDERDGMSMSLLISH